MASPRTPGRPDPSTPRLGGAFGLRFAVPFFAMLAAFYFLLASQRSERMVLQPYLHGCARLSAWCLQVLGHDATAVGTIITSPDYAVNIKRGCDAVEPSALFVAAVVASPVSAWTKLPGVASGILVLMGLNLLRVTTLFLVGIYAPRIFEWVHIAVWQPLFLVFAVGLWFLWARWARGLPAFRALLPARRAT